MALQLVNGKLVNTVQQGGQTQFYNPATGRWENVTGAAQAPAATPPAALAPAPTPASPLATSTPTPAAATPAVPAVAPPQAPTMPVSQEFKYQQMPTDPAQREAYNNRMRQMLVGFGSPELAKQFLPADDPFLSQISNDPDAVRPTTLGQISRNYLESLERQNAQFAQGNLGYSSTADKTRTNLAAEQMRQALNAQDAMATALMNVQLDAYRQQQGREDVDYNRQLAAYNRQQEDVWRRYGIEYQGWSGQRQAEAEAAAQAQEMEFKYAQLQAQIENWDLQSQDRRLSLEQRQQAAASASAGRSAANSLAAQRLALDEDKFAWQQYTWGEEFNANTGELPDPGDLYGDESDFLPETSSGLGAADEVDGEGSFEDEEVAVAADPYSPAVWAGAYQPGRQPDY